MANALNFDVEAVHKYFSVECFNQAWGLVEKTDRTPEEDEEMIRLSQASLWHWTQRDQCTNRNLSVSYWQLSRIYALLGQAGNAKRYGQLCLKYSQDEEIFYRGYAYEALARAEFVAGNKENMQSYIQEARRLAEAVPDPESKRLLLDDLEMIK